MKKTIIILSAAALVFASCQKEQPSSAIANGLQLTATVEQQDGGSASKTYLDNLAVKWSADDSVNVFTNAATPEKLTLTLTSGAGTTTGTFTTNDPSTGDPQYAIYPAGSNTINGSTITFTLPATQDYVANSFAKGANVAVGQVSNNSVNYKNVCGVFKLSIKGCYTVSRIELTGNASEKLNGTFTVDASATTPTANGGTEEPSEAEKKLTLNCGTNGVQLNVATATDFYFVVPAGAFASGFNAVVYDMVGDAYYATLSSTKVNTIYRSKVRLMPEAAAVRLPEEYTELELIQPYYDETQSSNTNSAFIITNIIPQNNVGFKIKFSTSASVSSTNYGALFGSRLGSSQQDFQLNTYSNSYFINGILRTGSTTYSAGIANDVILECSLFNGIYTDPNGNVSHISYNLNEATFPVSIFGINQGSGFVNDFSRGAKIYYVCFYLNNQVAFYGVPAKNSNGILGLYDLVADNFLVNSCTSTSGLNYFIAGTVLE